MKYYHKESKATYEVIGTIDVFILNKWVLCIEYKSDETGKRYVRTPENFNDKFEPLANETTAIIDHQRR